MTLTDFDATSWDDIYFAAYGFDADWWQGEEDTSWYAEGMAFTSAVKITADNLGASQAANLRSLWNGTDQINEGQYEMSQRG